MTSSERNHVARRDFAIAALVIAGGLAVAGASLLQFASQDERPLVLTQWSQHAPSQSDQGGKANAPAESKPGGARPTTPPPQPARPDADAQQSGAKPALPPAPAEKTAPPINTK